MHTQLTLSSQRLADQFHLSTKELILYELPVLVSLQFSLLVPYYQAHPHLLALRDSELALNWHNNLSLDTT